MEQRTLLIGALVRHETDRSVALVEAMQLVLKVTEYGVRQYFMRIKIFYLP